MGIINTIRGKRLKPRNAKPVVRYLTRNIEKSEIPNLEK